MVVGGGRSGSGRLRVGVGQTGLVGGAGVDGGRVLGGRICAAAGERDGSCR